MMPYGEKASEKKGLKKKFELLFFLFLFTAAINSNACKSECKRFYPPPVCQPLLSDCGSERTLLILLLAD